MLFFLYVAGDFLIMLCSKSRYAHSDKYTHVLFNLNPIDSRFFVCSVLSELVKKFQILSTFSRFFGWTMKFLLTVFIYTSLHHQCYGILRESISDWFFHYVILFDSSLADVIRVCHRSDININKCICDSIEMLRGNLATGDFGENFTIPKIEPMFIDEIKMHRNEFKATFRNLQVSGPSLFVLKNMRWKESLLNFCVFENFFSF